MEKYKLKTGENIFVVRVEHNISLRVFAVALTDTFYNNGEEFPEKLTKREAEKILRHSLFRYGCQGQFEDGYFEASFEESEKYSKILNPAFDWVKEKYEWLRDS